MTTINDKLTKMRASQCKIIPFVGYERIVFHSMSEGVRNDSSKDVRSTEYKNSILIHRLNSFRLIHP